MPEAFFEPDGDRFVATELTRGPWDPDSQHAGPPAALIAREVERLSADPARLVGRLTFEVLRPVPIGPVRVEAAVARPGRSVEMVEASLHDDDGEVIRARAWRLREGDLDGLEGELGWSDAGSAAVLRRDEALRLHQRRPDDPPRPTGERRVDLPRLDDDPRPDRDRDHRQRPLRRAGRPRPRRPDAARLRALTT
jgi:acyl-CoA thioesterase superfamily protein